MSEYKPVPINVVRLVNQFVEGERRDVEKYDNREHMDGSGVWGLHDLARNIYAAGWTDGYSASAEAERGARL